MNLLWKKITFTALILWIFFHYFFIIVNHSPLQAKGKMKSASVLYTFPFFCQNWSLFVPAPTHAKTFFVRYKTAGNFTPWKHTGTEVILKYKKCPATGSDMMLLLVTNSLYYVCADFTEQSAVFNTENAKPAFRVFKHITDKLLQTEYKLAPQTAYELLIVEQGTPNRVLYFKNLGVK